MDVAVSKPLNTYRVAGRGKGGSTGTTGSGSSQLAQSTKEDAELCVVQACKQLPLPEANGSSTTDSKAPPDTTCSMSLSSAAGAAATTGTVVIVTSCNACADASPDVEPGPVTPMTNVPLTWQRI